MGDYNHAINGLANGWAIVVLAFVAHLAGLLWLSHDEAHIVGIGLCVAAHGAAYLGEAIRAGALAWPHRVSRVLHMAAIGLPCASWLLWFLVMVR